MSVLIKAENLSFAYNTYTENNDDTKNYMSNEKLMQIPALKNINLEINRGTFTAVLGHNGSGKSTLAKLFNAILIPTNGKIFVENLDTADEENLFQIRRKVGMVFQNPDNQIVSTIVEEDVAFGPENLGIAPDEIRKRVDDALEMVGMSKYKLHAPHQLSGGQKQRIAIASVLAMMPDCIIFDESTAMLDPQGREEVLKVIQKLNKQQNITAILITHYMEEAIRADRVIAMNKGEICLDGTPKEVFSQIEKIKKIGLDVPQVNELFYLLRKEQSLGNLKKFKFPADILDVKTAADLIEKYYHK